MQKKSLTDMEGRKRRSNREGGAKGGLQLRVHKTELILVLLPMYYIIFHINNCKPTFALHCV